jgi:phosphoribosyl 1,2-cyclic phosphodiesterase
MTAPTLTFRGVRGSVPVSGPDTNRYGGHTLCADVAAGPHTMVLIDGGTGITELHANSARFTDYHVFFTHYHWDHIQGLLFFRPLFDGANSFTFYGHGWEGKSSQAALEAALRPPWFPVSIRDTAAHKQYVTIESTAIKIGELKITSAQLRHPQGVTAYRIDGPNRSVVIATDCERGDPNADAALNTLASGADILVHDAQYVPEEYDSQYVGWGHSTWAQAAEAAREAGVEQLVLVSHDPARSDDDIDALVANTRESFANTTAAFEGMEIPL